MKLFKTARSRRSVASEENGMLISSLLHQETFLSYLILSNHFNLSIALHIHTVSSRVFHPHLVLIVSLSHCHEQPRLIVFYIYHTTHKALLVLS